MLAEIFRGRNYSDVGVPMYTTPSLGFLAGLVGFVLVGALAARQVDRVAPGAGPWAFGLHALWLLPQLMMLGWLTG